MDYIIIINILFVYYKISILKFVINRLKFLTWGKQLIKLKKVEMP
jgi:hypothetical protein